MLTGIADREDTPSRTLYYLGHALMRTGEMEEAKRRFEAFVATWRGDRRLIDEVQSILDGL